MRKIPFKIKYIFLPFTFVLVQISLVRRKHAITVNLIETEAISPKTAPVWFPSECQISVNRHKQHATGRIYLHLGPYKTGSTTIQQFFASNIKLFQQNNVSYYGKQVIFDITPQGSQFNPIKFNSVKSKLEIEVGENRQIAFFSDEELHTKKKTMELFKTLSHNTTTIQPIIVYRHFFERTLSGYKYHFRPESPKWVNWEDFQFPSFATHLEKRLDKLPLTLQVIDFFNKLLADMTKEQPCFLILNMHDEKFSLLDQVLNNIFDSKVDTVLQVDSTNPKGQINRRPHSHVGLS